MKKFVVCCLVASGVTLAFYVQAIAAAGGGLKIGYFDLEAVVTQSETGKKFLEEMKKKEEELNAVLEKKGKEFLTARDEYEKKREVMDEKAKARKEKELGDMYAEVQKMRTESNAKLSDQLNAARAPIIKKIIDLANKIGKEDKYDFIFDKRVIAFAGSEKDDLTKRIASGLDKEK